MPVRKCVENGKPGYKCGDSGKCYTYTSNNEQSRKRAKAKAIRQCLAMDEPIEERLGGVAERKCTGLENQRG